MFPGSARPIPLLCLVVAVAPLRAADEPVALPRQAPAKAVARPPREAAATPVAATADPARVKAEAEARLKELAEVKDKELTAAQKALREIWNERLKALEDWEKATRGRQVAENPSPTPERELADRKAELARAQEALDGLKGDPDSALPGDLRASDLPIDDARLGEMRKAIEAAKATVRDRMAEGDRLRAEAGARAKLLEDLRADREAVRARLAALPARRTELESAFFSAATEEARRVARERLINIQWEAAVEAQRLAMAEAFSSLEARRGATAEVATRACDLHLGLARAALAAIEGRYRLAAERQKAELRQEAEKQKARATTAEDPVEKFKARRNVELLALEAQILEDEKALDAIPPTVEAERKAAAKRAEDDFADLKQVVKENRIGGLVALRLNNDFRRISRERELIARNELAAAAAANTFYENALTEAELSYFNDARDDRFERDAFLETLPPARRPAAAAAIDGLEARHKTLLARHRDVLDRLLKGAEETHKQVARRLRCLDEQYTFIRTHLFWVRDSEPIGMATVVQLRREANRLASACARLAAEPLDPSSWTRATADFGLATVGLVVFPFVIRGARRRLKAAMA